MEVGEVNAHQIDVLAGAVGDVDAAGVFGDDGLDMKGGQIERVARTEVQHGVATAARSENKLVSASPARDLIVSGPTGDGVVAAAAGNRVIAAKSAQDIGGVVAAQIIRDGVSEP